MGHEQLKHIKDNLMYAIEGQICNLAEADTEELGAAVDMLKDLEEALYYCTITEAMEGKDKKQEYRQQQSPMYYTTPQYNYHYPIHETPMMYYNGSQGGNNGSSSSNGGNSSSSSNYSEPMSMRDWREGRSPQSRRMYMEAKENKHDKSLQLRELEKYMQELTSDMVEMIQDSTPEEKQYLEKKISALASKIGQMK